MNDLQQKLKFELGADMFWGFHQHSRSYYASHNPLEKGVSDEVWFGGFSTEGGTVGEMCMRWRFLGGCLVPQLQVFDDAWFVLSLLSPELMPKLGVLDNQNISPTTFCELLLSLGFEDKTKTSNSQ